MGEDLFSDGSAVPAWHKRPEYEPKTLQQKLGYAVEEMGEAMAAIGKTIRYGLASYNPELPPGERELNGDWALRELRDVERAARYAIEALRVEMTAINGNERGGDAG
jgi:hypothetical protein